MEPQYEERRLTTILAADVVGYSRLMGEDEARTLSALKAHRKELLDPKAAQYRGRTVKLMGDGALMEFASVVDAVSFAVEVQCAMDNRNADVPEDKRIIYRIGINIGDVIVEDDDIYGDGVNVAARLEGLAEPGGICVSRTVFNHVNGKLDLTFDHVGEKEIKNIAQPVTVYRVALDDKAAALGTPVVQAPIAKSRKGWAVVSAAVAVVLLGAVGLAWWQPWAPKLEPASVERMALPLPEKPSIAVIPFDNMSGDTEQNYFADGMTEDLITDLSKLSGIFVISRNSSWTYKGKPVKVQQVAEELGVRYVLEGSVRRRGDQIRINAQLIDAIGGHHLWAERYDGALSEVFALQDNVIGQIVAALAVNLTSAEQARVGQVETANPQAYDAFLQGWEHLRQDTEEDTLKSIALFEKAVEIDPGYGRGYAALAAANWRIVVTLWGSTAGIGWERAWERLNQNLAKAMETPTSLAHAISAQVLAQQGRYDEAFAEINRAMALAPNDPDNHIGKAKILNATARAAEAEEAARWAMRLDPQYAPDYLRVLALALFHQERYEDAVETLKRVVSRQSDVVEDYATLVSSFGHLGRSEDVPATIEKYNALAIPAGFDPLTVQEMGWWWYGDIFDYDDHYRERVQEGLRKAGVPDGAGTDLSREEYLRFIVKSGGEYNVEGATKIDAAAAKALLDLGSVRFVDVRAHVDFDRGHIPGATNLSLVTDLSKANLSEAVGKSSEVAFYCHGKHCPYSAYASAKALAWGFAQVYYFAGGFPAWNDAGYPVEVTPTQ
jgi:TolB-like protein/class 3 adenylate cyclase/rhodanese-related sulfurtransferase